MENNNQGLHCAQLGPQNLVCDWPSAMAQIAQALAESGVSPADAVVLVPYLQLMEPARQAWSMANRQSSRNVAAFFVPRFETTQTWADRLGGAEGLFEAQGSDLRLDKAFDRLTAASLLAQVGLAGQSGAVVNRLVEAAWSLARVAASIPPEERLAWGESKAQALALGLDAPVLLLEASMGRIALAWAAASSYATDRLFALQPAFFAVLEGFQNEPLAEALKTRFALLAPVLAIALVTSQEGVGLPAPALHPAGDPEDEAQRAAACVLRHLAQGHQPVALIAQDRLLTRRIGALLLPSGITMRDETGWTLSTTRAAAGLMGFLRAMAFNASADDVLDWLKNAPAFEPQTVAAAESALRQRGLRYWRDLPVAKATSQPTRAALESTRASVEALRRLMRPARPLGEWLADLREALQHTGQWQPLAGDAAGQKVLQVLRLQPGAEAEFKEVPALLAAMKPSEFTQWVGQTLEGETFSPLSGPGRPQVLILPLAQLLGRKVAAIVFAGCDEQSLPVSPEPPGGWSRAQRALLGLPSRGELAAALQRAWRYALAHPRLDLLWRTQQGGDHLTPSGLVRALLLDMYHLDGQAAPFAADPRIQRQIAVHPTPRPQATGQALPVARLSASAYTDLRSCPYRFHAAHQLRLKSPDELDSELDKRDFGNWLHQTLKLFHEALKALKNESKVPLDQQTRARAAIINIAAEQAKEALRLSAAEFLPFAAAWPGVRDGYLAWLERHEASGAAYDQGEVRFEAELRLPPALDEAWGKVTLTGVLDRIDRQPDGQWLLMDYKAESSEKSKKRITEAAEDTQLAFYAALTEGHAPPGPLAAGYLNLGEDGKSSLHSHSDMAQLRDALRDGIASDLSRIGRGEVLQALGEGAVCETCTARGLCRRDFWVDL